MLYLVAKDQRHSPSSASGFGTGGVKNLSQKFQKYLATHEETKQKLLSQYRGDVLLFDSLFESGNLL